MKKEYLFSYNIHPEYDYDEYKKAAVILDNILLPKMEVEEIVDPLDGTRVRTYSNGNEKVKLFCDWDIGAVFVDSDIAIEKLDAYIKVKQSNQRIKDMRDGKNIKCPRCQTGYISAVGDPITTNVFRCNECETGIILRIAKKNI